MYVIVIGFETAKNEICVELNIQTKTFAKDLAGIMKSETEFVKSETELSTNRQLQSPLKYKLPKAQKINAIRMFCTMFK